MLTECALLYFWLNPHPTSMLVEFDILYLKTLNTIMYVELLCHVTWAWAIGIGWKFCRTHFWKTWRNFGRWL